MDNGSTMQLLQHTTQKRLGRSRLALVMGVLALAAYHGESQAADNATSEAGAVPDAHPATQEDEFDTKPQYSGSTAAVSSPSAASPSAEVQKAQIEQRLPSAHGEPSQTAAVVPIPSSPPPPYPSGPPPLTLFGVTLYGVIDVGFSHLSHGAPASNTYGPGLPYVVQNYSNRSMTSVAGNGLSQSKLGLSGVEPLGALDMKAVFKLETGFQPTTGRLTDGPKSLLDNNGRANADKVTAGDSARAGQPFQGAAFAGISSAMLGTLTFGRQNSLMADNLIKYDPQLQSQAFSPIGYSGAAGGLGDTEDKTLDDSLKYIVGLGPLHLAALYQFGRRGFAPPAVGKQGARAVRPARQPGEFAGRGRGRPGQFCQRAAQARARTAVV